MMMREMSTMMKSEIACVAAACAAAASFAGTDLAPIDSSADRNPSPLRVDMKRIGTLRPRSVNEIKGSPWMIDSSCLDRDFNDFDEYKDYIVPLGIKEIRVLAGWAKCEREPGKFDFAWLDHCVDWANGHGVNVYLDISYGNPIYKGAGGAGLANGIPNTPEGLAHWDNWVETLGNHYKGRIRDYAMWNEPDNGGMNTSAMIADLDVRTARILKRIMPDCRLHGLSLCSTLPEKFEECISEIARLGGVDLFDTFVYHGYSYNPDATYDRVEKLAAICAKYAPNAKLRQGENGCPSEWGDRFALKYYPWSENSQAKWDMRRMLGDAGHGFRSCVFAFCDIQYGGPHSPFEFLNRKGVLRTNAKHQVYQIKKAYYAVQNVVSVFDDSVVAVDKPRVSTVDRCLSLYEFVKDGRHRILAFWDHGLVGVKMAEREVEDGTGRVRVVSNYDSRQVMWITKEKNKDGFVELAGLDRRGVPSDDFTTRPAIFEWEGEPMKEPVWVDLFTGAVYEIPAKRQIVHKCGVSLVRIPAYDSPCLVAERVALDLMN